MNKKSKKDFYSTLTATYRPAFGGIGRVIRKSSATKSGDIVKIRVRQNGISALDATKQKVAGFSVEYIAGLGWMITSVNGVAENVATGQFWKYFVNNQFINTSADRHIVNRGDKIEWRLVTEN